MVLVDTHCHLFDLKEYKLPPEIYPVIVGYNHNSNKKAVELSKSGYPFALGIAPQTAVREGIDKLDEWEEFIRAHKPNAIGEIGLDYKWAQNAEHVEKQRLLFDRMIRVARDKELPIVVHSRNNPNKETDDNQVPQNAINEIIERVMGMRFLMHFYSGSPKQAEQIVEMGGYISVSHLRSKERRATIEKVPIDRLVVESDCPYIGRTPEVVKEAVAYIAEVKKVSLKEVEEITTKNAQKFFGFKVQDNV
ncbi:TatD family hydrolase [Candidatus Micrarchaeota archaeon]|nr:TatD family hydrolase [Candidatus Micrarchaeota archaeon]